MKIFDVPDDFYVRPQPKHFAAARPSERQELLRYVSRYLRACEQQDHRLPSLRELVNR